MSNRTTSWREQLRRSIVCLDDLPLPKHKMRTLANVVKKYPMRIPRHLAEIIDWNDPRCPIKRQVLPSEAELDDLGCTDPLDEERFKVAPGVIRRFDDRLLALVHHTCPILCRHCNRKRTWLTPLVPAGAEEIAKALSKSNHIKEVILSGGEPLLLSDKSLDSLLCAARSKPGVQVLRVHSRAPVSLPSRITPALVSMLKSHDPLWFVTHFNTHKELSAQSRRALAVLRSAGIPVLNQAVLLRGVNDSTRALAALGRALVSAGVKPYYLFQLDMATGTTHFQVPLRRGLEIVSRLQRNHSGLLVPRYMADLPGRGGKVELSPEVIVKWTDKGAILRGADGKKVLYEDKFKRK